MPVRHDALLAHALARELGGSSQGDRASALLLDAERRAAELRFGEAPSLLFLLHPEAGYLLPGSGETAAGDFGELAGHAHTFRRLFLGRPETPADERLLLLPLVDRQGRERHRVVVELHTNQWNLLLIDVPSLRIRAVLWPREAGGRVLRPDATYAPPSGSRRGADEPLSLAAWHSLLAPEPPARRRGVTLRTVAWSSSVNVDWILGAATEPAPSPADEPAPFSPDEAASSTADRALEAAHGRYLELWETLRSLPEGPVPCHLLKGKRGPTPYPLPLGQGEGRRFPSILEAMVEAAAVAGARERWVAPGGVAAGAVQATRAEEAGRLREVLLSRRRALRRRRSALRRELEEGEDPAELRSAGNLLLARLREVTRGSSTVRLRDFDGEERELALDPALDAAENAALYYERAAKRERAAERIPQELESSEQELRAVEEALERLEAEGPSESLWEAAGGRPSDRKRGAEEERLPYRRYRSSGGLEIRVGRGARSNDDLTFHHSAPEDIWLHARQAKGAHVILRWGRREGNPPRRDLLQAAVAAALHSGARHSGTVPVDWTRRKYVRKPRKSPPGAVVPDRVQTLFVEPDEKLLKKMKFK